MTTETKIFKSRDSATAALRKLGVTSVDYALYIEKHKDGFKCFIGEAHIALKGDVSNDDGTPPPSPVKSSKKQATAQEPVELKTQTKLFDKREDAAKFITSLGVKPEFVDQFLETTESGRTLALSIKAVLFANNGNKKPALEKRDDTQISISRAAKAHTAGVTKEIFASDVKKAVTTDKKRGPQERTTTGSSMSAFMRRLIIEGKTNEEVLAAAVTQFRLNKEETSKKAGYPAWYRFDCKRKGLIAQ